MNLPARFSSEIETTAQPAMKPPAFRAIAVIFTESGWCNATARAVNKFTGAAVSKILINR
ncbi:MAG: hypothetical protein IH604_13020 [Burkholderiales bacterium]|nr:hypothetical protein [Burkholderiales bacterium]